MTADPHCSVDSKHPEGDSSRSVRGSARAAGWVLRLGLAAQAAALLWLTLRQGTQVNTGLFMHAGWSEAAAARVDVGLAGLACAGALAALALPGRAWAQLAAAGAVAVAFLTQAAVQFALRGDGWAHLAPAAQAVRWLAPLALPLLVAGRTSAAVRVLAWATAATFATHGFEAAAHHPRFVDLLLGASRRLFSAAPDQAVAERILTGIGAMDFAVAALLVLRPRPGIALWAAAWGLLTLASRTVALGPEFLHASLLRAMNAAAPLCLGLTLLRSRKQP